VINVHDNGRGMTSDVRTRAFEPFYTTKDVGAGSGLGLSQVYGFVKQSGGHVEISSELDVGTTVSLYVPMLQGATAKATAPMNPSRNRADATGSETILVVEDDAEVRNIVADQLRALGYRVLTAVDGPTAVATMESGESVDLLFSDVVMPNGMRGDELARKAVGKRPGLKVLLTSGYALETRNEATPQEFAVLSKPYRQDELAKAIRAALDG
jgi:CheY-like chemotaxis protein